MKIIVTNDTNEDMTYESLEISIDDVYKFRVYHDMEAPEDNDLGRNFSDCHDIPDMMRKAYIAGKNGEDFEIEYIGDED